MNLPATALSNGAVPGRIQLLHSIIPAPGDSFMSDRKIPRRDVLKGALIGVATVPVTALLGRAEAASGKVDPSEPQAKSLGYVTDATTVDPKTNPNYKPGQICANCLQVPAGKDKGAEIPCNIFAGRLVDAKGWCKVYVKRA
jgi:hypothetical protein